MPICKNIDTKYIHEYASGIEILIERAGEVFYQKIPYRTNGGMQKTWEAGRLLRDRMHMEMFGFPVTQGFFHVKRKTKAKSLTLSSNQDTNIANGDSLPSGVSIGYSRGKPLYAVSSWTCRFDLKVKRKRFNINKIGYDEAIRLAQEHRAKEIINNYIPATEQSDLKTETQTIKQVEN